MEKALRPLVGVFLAVACGCGFFKSQLLASGVDVDVVLAGNALLFAASLLTYFMYRKAMGIHNAHGFVRRVSGTFVIKFFVIVTAALCYFYFSETVNKPAIIICAALYLVYNFISTAQVVKKKSVGK